MKWSDALGAWSAFGSAVVAFLALAAAVVAAIAAWKANNAQTRQVEFLGEDRKRRLAGGFGVWMGPVDPQGFPRTLYYHNAGPLPVYGVTLHIRIGEEDMEYLPLGDLGPSTGPQPLAYAGEQIYTAVEDRVAQEIQKATKPLDLEGATRLVILVSILHEVRIIATLFRDANGTKWIRETSGTLRQGWMDTYEGYLPLSGSS